MALAILQLSICHLCDILSPRILQFLSGIDLHCVCFAGGDRDMSAGTHFVRDLPEPSDRLLLLARQPCSSDVKGTQVTETLSEMVEIDCQLAWI